MFPSNFVCSIALNCYLLLLPMQTIGQDICDPPFGEWEKAGLGGTEFHSVGVPFSLNLNNYILHINLDDNFLRSMDCGGSWDTLRSAPEGGFADVAFPSSTLDMMIVATEQKVLMLPDSVNTFEQIDAGLELGSSEFIEDIKIFSGIPRTIYVSTSTNTAGHLYRTKDYGQSWQDVTPTSDIKLHSYTVLDSEVGPMQQGLNSVIVKGTSKDTMQLWKGSITDEEWQSLNRDLFDKKLVHLSAGISHRSIVMATQDTIYYGGIHFGMDNFISITDTTALPDDINGVKFLEHIGEKERPIYIVVSDEGEIMENFSSPAGTWNSYKQNLPETSTVTSLDHGSQNFRGHMVFLTLKEAGLYSRRTYMIGKVQDNSAKMGDFKLWANYPNPFNPSTQIKYSIPKTTEVTLEVYSLLGQRVEVLVDKRQKPGVYEVTFDAGNLSSGTYFYRLRAGGFQEVKQMMFVK